MIRWLRSWFTPDVKFDLFEAGVGWRVPSRGSKEAAGLDLYAAESLVIGTGETKRVRLNIKSSFNPGWAACIWDRSGMGFKGIHRFAGLIDSDYRGEWGVVLHNTGLQEVTINAGDRIGQVVFQRCWIGTPKLGYIDCDTERGTAGFGSTGK